MLGSADPRARAARARRGRDRPSCEDRRRPSAYAEVVLAETAVAGDDLVLVGHSLGGLTIPLVAAARPVRALVFLCALLPQPGLSLVDQLASGAKIFYPGSAPELPTVSSTRPLLLGGRRRRGRGTLRTARASSPPGQSRACGTRAARRIPTPARSASGRRWSPRPSSPAAMPPSIRTGRAGRLVNGSAAPRSGCPATTRPSWPALPSSPRCCSRPCVPRAGFKEVAWRSEVSNRLRSGSPGPSGSGACSS